MSEGVEGILILLGVTVVVALAAHTFSKKYLVVSAVAAMVSVVVFQALNYMHLGHVDPFLPVAVLVSAAVCFVVSLLVGLPFRWKRMKRARRARGDVHRP